MGSQLRAPLVRPHAVLIPTWTTGACTKTLAIGYQHEYRGVRASTSHLYPGYRLKCGTLNGM
jgi:hypothetical protein